MTEIRSINALRAERDNDNSLLSPAECLEDAAQDVRTGERKCQKVLILTLDVGDDDAAYNVGFYAANMKTSEKLALIEAAKSVFLRNMGY